MHFEFIWGGLTCPVVCVCVCVCVCVRAHVHMCICVCMSAFVDPSVYETEQLVNSTLLTICDGPLSLPKISEKGKCCQQWQAVMN